MRRVLIAVVLSAACSSGSVRPDEAQVKEPLVTRQSEPLEPRPKRMAASRFQVGEDMEMAIEDVLAAESESAEIMAITGLSWADGRRTIAVSHVRFPPHDMAEVDFDQAVDEETLERCDTEFQDCVDGLDSCQEDAYEACIRSAYRNAFVYMSSHLGIDCGVLELSMFEAKGLKPRLIERRVIDSMVCDYDFIGGSPAAADLDGDGGPELVYTWSSSDPANIDGEMLESIAIFDANTLTEQYALKRQMLMDEYGEQQDVMGVTPVDLDENGLFDLRTSMVKTSGYCVGYGWALDARFVIPEDEVIDEPTCQIDIEQQVHPYDPVKDVWGRTAEPEPDEGT